MNKFQMMATLIVGLAAELDGFNTEERKRSFLAQQGETTIENISKSIGSSIWSLFAGNKPAQIALRQAEFDRFMATMEKNHEDSRISDIQKAMFLDMVKFFVKNYEREGSLTATLGSAETNKK